MKTNEVTPNIYKTSGVRFETYPFSACVKRNNVVRRKMFKDLESAKKWVDLQCIRFGVAQKYNTYKTVI